MANNRYKEKSTVLIGVIRLIIGVFITFFILSIINKDLNIENVKLALTNYTNSQVNSNYNDLTVHFIDVGQGDSTLIEYKDIDIIIDGGDEKEADELLDYLLLQNIDDIDLMIATHMDADHIGGLDDIVNSFDVVEVIDSGTTKDTKAYKNYKKSIDTDSIQYSEDSDFTIRFDNDFSIDIIDTGDNYDSENNNSVVCQVKYKDVSVLFTGDMEYEAEQQNLDKFSKVDVLKVGHHGSKTSSSNSFLHKVDPIYSIISCGKDNEYGHPHLETLEKFKKINSKVLRTDIYGTITLYSDGYNIQFN